MHGKRSAPIAAWRATAEATFALSREVDRELRRAGLPGFEWYDALFALYEAPNRRLRMSELVDDVMLLSRTGLTRLVDRLEAAGAVRREPVPGDRRGTAVVLTPAGVATMRAMWRVYSRVLRARFHEQVGADAPVVARALGRVVAEARVKNLAKSEKARGRPLAERDRPR